MVVRWRWATTPTAALSRARVSGQHGREDVSSSNSNNNTMGCVHATTILTNEDLEFIAKNTALTKVQVEVWLKPGIPYSRIICDKIKRSNIAESVPELLEASP